ncbi:ent-kaurenoic acid oxidase 1 [Prunus yedoensis var. nudiflora]|uniref:Ent-kaurenoic acid oxidase 1 n=1 Tax=Prunus yedoensis var. nudiflora TaxID=2094558 RepID=A0A314XNY8_PRUYE|nr:ent-kaurenoic acid oxidase 1 [Prunus yedoensis var. nudiflora]
MLGLGVGMELGSAMWMVLLCSVCALVALKWLLQNANSWLYETPLGEKQYSLPPGDLGWPFIGNMWSFLKAFKSSNPETFVNSLVSRFGRTGIYKAFMFGSPSVIVTTPEASKRVLTDDDAFKPGWPLSTLELIGKNSFIGISYEEHKRLRRLTAAPVNGHEALSMYMKYIEDIVVTSLEKWSKMGEIEFLTQLRKLTFRIIMYIFLSSESEPVMDALEREYTILNYGVRAMAINLPGFAYHKALKARKNLVSTFQSIVDERRAQRKSGNYMPRKKDMMDALLDVVDDDGRKLTDLEIIDAEQEEIVKRRPPTQKGMAFKEYREMEYLSQVIDETLRVITFSLTVFREAKKDVNINGYSVPKGWKVLVWFRSIHYDSEIYPNPMEFNPDRWDNYTPKPLTFLPFGAGSRLCPGNDLAKLEIAIFLHYFLLNYKMERSNPDCPLMYLPHTRPKDNCLARIKKTGSA